jgi:hypothetical protein
MLAGQNQALHPTVARGADDLISIKVGGVEECGRLIPIAPLTVRECVYGEMEKAVELELMPCELP